MNFQIDMNNGNPVEPSASKKTADDEFDQELKDAEEKQLNDDDFIMDYVVPEKEDEIPLGKSLGGGSCDTFAKKKKVVHLPYDSLIQAFPW